MDIYPNAVRGLGWPVLKRPNFDTIVQTSPNKYETRVRQTVNPIWDFQLMYSYLKNDPNDLVESLAPYTDYEVLEGFFMGHYGQFDSFLFFDAFQHSVGPALLSTAWQRQHAYRIGDSILDPSKHWQQVTAAGISGLIEPTWDDAGSTTADGADLIWTDQGEFDDGFPNPAAQLSVIAQGGTSYSPVQRNVGGWFLEDVTDLSPDSTAGSIKVYANGVLQTAGSDYALHGPGLNLVASSYMGLYLQWSSAPTEPVTAEFDYFFRVRFGSDAEDFEQFMANLYTMGGSAGKAGKGYLDLRTARPVPLI